MVEMIQSQGNASELVSFWEADIASLPGHNKEALCFEHVSIENGRLRHGKYLLGGAPQKLLQFVPP